MSSKKNKKRAAKEVFVMKKSLFWIIAIFALSFASGVSADNGKAKQSPESILMCTDLTQHGVFSVLSTSIPSEINAGQCRTLDIVEQPDLCAACVGALEAQGCKIIDVDVVQVEGTEFAFPGHAKVTYLISCSKP